MISCLLNGIRINYFDGMYNKEQLKTWAKKKILICPACNKPYEYCHGKVKSPYFRHMEKEQCEDKYVESETEEHIKGKRDLYEWLKTQDGVTDCILEGWIPETKQRPDIIFKYNLAVFKTVSLGFEMNIFIKNSPNKLSIIAQIIPITEFIIAHKEKSAIPN